MDDIIISSGTDTSTPSLIIIIIFNVQTSHLKDQTATLTKLPHQDGIQAVQSEILRILPLLREEPVIKRLGGHNKTQKVREMLVKVPSGPHSHAE